MKKLKLISFMCLIAIIFGSCTRTQDDKDVSEFEHNGHQYIQFTWGANGFHAAVVHNPDCPCFSNDFK